MHFLNNAINTMNFKRLVLNIITLVFTLQVNAIPFNYGSKISKKVVLVGDTLSYTVEAYCTPSCQLVWPNLQSSIQEPLVILQKGELQKTEKQVP